MALVKLMILVEVGVVGGAEVDGGVGVVMVIVVGVVLV